MTQEEQIQALGQPDDIKASLAMMEILSTPEEKIMQLIGIYQDTDIPLLRKRMQQLSSIFTRKCLSHHLKEFFSVHEYTNWDLLCQLNVILDQHSSLQQIHDVMNSITAFEEFHFRSSEQLADFLREAGFAPSRQLHHSMIDYLVSEVLLSRTGSPLVLAVIAEETARLHGWNATAGMIGSRPVLRDGSFNVLDPQNNWAISHPNLGDFQPFEKQDLVLRILTYTVNVSILEQLHTVTYNALNQLTLLGRSLDVTPVWTKSDETDSQG